MTNEQKMLVSSLRAEGMGYGTIARRIGISESTVKSFCRRSVRRTGTEQQYMLEISEHKCLRCGVRVEQTAGRKEKKFCSDRCRNKWWNSHLDQVDRRAVHEFICLNCKKTFSVYGCAVRKYCCHQCYIEHRFGGVSNE